VQDGVPMDKLRSMLEREEELRWAPGSLQRMREAREWLDVAEELQLQVVREFGFQPEQERWALAEMRGAHIRYPELTQVSVWARNNLARNGVLTEGDEVPDVALFHDQGSTSLHSILDREKPTVLLCGSWS